MSSIDVVVPCYKYARYLRQCVSSILAQEVADLRVLVIDDASPDDTSEVGRELAREDPRVTLITHKHNLGHIATYNEGIAWLKADYMLLLSADDFLLPGALAAAVDALDRAPGTGLCIGAATEIDAADRKIRKLDVDVDFAGQPARYLTGTEFAELCIRSRCTNVVPTPTAVVRTRLLRESGGYRAELPHTADLEMWLRMAALSGVCVLARTQAVYRRHANNMSDAYYHDNCLLDLQQRRAAFDAFSETCAPQMPEAPALHQRFLAGLAREAVLQASGAFNEKRFDLSRQLADLALSFNPDIHRSRAWKLLSLKRFLGYRITRALLPLNSLAQAPGQRSQS